MTTRTLIPSLAAVAAIAATGAVNASGQGAESPTTRTLTFVAPTDKGVGHETDVKPRGETPGDQFQSYVPIYDTAGKRVGRREFVGVGLPQRRGMLFGALVLKDGQVIFQASLVDIDDATYAVTGGTGAYAGATGTVVLSRGKKGKVNIVVRIG